MTKLISLLIAAIAAPGLGQSQSGGMRQVAIPDPVLDMPAWTLTAPANWKVDGSMLVGSSCNSGTSPAFRASSPDGLTGAYLLPRSDWAWGANIRPTNDCLPFHEALSAKDFLTYFIRVRGLGYVSDEPVPELANMRRNNDAFNQQARGTMQMTGDLARYLVRYSLNGKDTEERITATVTCTDSMVLGIGHQYGCSAFVTRWFAPYGKLQAMIPTFQAMAMTLNQPWMDQWTAVMIRGIRAKTQRQTEALLEQGRLAQAQRMNQHQDFMNSMQRGREIRNERFQEGQYLKQKNKEDYVDYILDCQRASNGTIRVAVGNCQARQTQ